MKHFRIALVSLLAGSLLIPCSLVAQTDRGSIKGDVQDEQKALAPGVTLTLTNEATGVVSTTVSQSAGQYSFSNLQPGQYRITTSSAGFGKSALEHINVTVGSTTALNVVLRVANADQVIDVTANGSQVETQTSDIGTTITPREIQDLPVAIGSDSRNPLSFVTLTPGVAVAVPGNPPDYRLHISGSPSNSNEVYIDGIPIVNTNLAGDISLTHPPIDAVSEFKVVTNNQPAQYGLASSAISFAFKSGANQLHGSLFEFIQNDKLNANDSISNALHQKRAPLKQNEYGGFVSGPVFIPKIYNGHDKTFFFFEYSQFSWRPSSNNASLTTIPNDYRTGDLSRALGTQLTTADGTPILDALNRPIFNGEIYDPTVVRSVIRDGQTYQVRDPFPGNIIPASRFSTVSNNVLSAFPLATNSNLNNNYFRVQSTKNDEHRLVGKIDHTINAKHNIAGSVFIGTYVYGNNGSLTSYDNNVTNAPTHQYRGTYNYSHSPTVSNNFNAGFLRDTNANGPSVLGPGVAGLGITGLPIPPGAEPYPAIGLSGALSTGLGGPQLARDAENRFLANDNLSIIRGKHSFTVGGEVRRLQRNDFTSGDPRFTFDPGETALNGTGFANGKPISIPAVTGNSAASFLVGAVGFSISSFPFTSGYRWLQTGYYVQDDWKVRKNLVLNLGLRYDIQVPRTEVHGYSSTVSLAVPNPNAGNIPGGLTFYGNGPGRNGQKRVGITDYKAFQPRVGFAWSPYEDQKTSIRGGYAITRPTGNDNLENGIGSNLYAIGFSGTAIAALPGDAVGSPAYYWDSPFPANGVTPPQLSPGILVGLTNPVIIRPTAGIPPTQMNWALQVQQEFPGKMIASIGYVGSHSYHIGVWSKPNEVNPAVAAKYASAAASVNLPLNQYLAEPILGKSADAGNLKEPFPGFAKTFGAGATIAQSLRPFPQYGSVDNPINPIGSVSYNGLQTSLQRRFSEGLTFLVSYTFSKTIGNVDSNNGLFPGAENAPFSGSFYQDYYNPRGDRSVTSSDVPHVVSLSYTYELPIGKNKRFLNRGGVTNEVLGGWQVAGIQTYQSGRPIHIEFDAFGNDNPLRAQDGFSFRPNIVPGQSFKNPGYRKSCSGPLSGAACSVYINPAAFSRPTSGEFGNAPHFISALRLPAFLNESISVSKRFQIYERSDLQFQANAFNLLNRAVFSNGGNANTFIINNAPANLGGGLGGSAFGQLTAQQNSPRTLQFALKLEF